MKASEVAGNLGGAIADVEGVAPTAPAIDLDFRNRVVSIAASTSLLADQLLRKVYHAARDKPSAVAAEVAV